MVTQKNPLKRSLWVALALVSAIALIAVTWFVAMRFQSSAQREASAQPPQPTPVVVAITKTDLVERTTLKANGVRDNERAVSLPKVGNPSVITAHEAQLGHTLESGKVIAWVNDRPVFVFKGVFPLYRDIGVGDSGEDVRMIQQALAELGYSVKADGQFGTWTGSIISSLYQSVGSQAATREVRENPAENTGASTAENTQKQSGERANEQPRTSTAVTKEVVLKANEVMILPELPALISSLPPVGTLLGADNTAIKLTGHSISMTSKVPGTVGARMQVGLQGVATLGERSVDVQISAITDPEKEQTHDPVDTLTNNQTSDVQGPREMVVHLKPTQGEFPADWGGQTDILVSLELTQPLLGVLTVPQRAIATDATGQASILVKNDDSFTQSPIRQLQCLAGICAIEGAGIYAGQEVRVDR